MGKKKSYLQKYKEAIDDLMKNDDTIFNEENNIRKVSKKKSQKKISKNSNNRNLSTNNNYYKKKPKEIRPQIKMYKINNSKYSKVNSRNKTKKNFYGSVDTFRNK